jgi:ribonuclease HII
LTTLARLIAETCRLRLLHELEEQLGQWGYARIAGVDEAGRGCLAGPVVAAAVIPDPRRLLPGVDDSKQLAPEERERLALAIRATALTCCVCEVAAETIDSYNILEASRQAMRRALAGLNPRPDCAVIDAVALIDLGFPCFPVVRGDQISYAVACASILAKVERDRRMTELDRDYPQYGFASHKGYAAPEHLRALNAYGPSPIHRLTFRSVVPRLDDSVEGDGMVLT